jgi:tRNA (mo5U34)-methyltransferase
VGRFDVALFLGVFYHLLDPVHGLTRAASVTDEVLVVETHCDGFDQERPGMVFYPGRELGNDPTSWWGPSPSCVIALLRTLGFATIDAAWAPLGPPRGVFHAWRSHRLRRSFAPPTCMDLAASVQAPRPVPGPRVGRLRGLVRRWRGSPD